MNFRLFEVHAHFKLTTYHHYGRSVGAAAQRRVPDNIQVAVDMAGQAFFTAQTAKKLPENPFS